jgi:hypothetical protein
VLWLPDANGLAGAGDGWPKGLAELGAGLLLVFEAKGLGVVLF